MQVILLEKIRNLGALGDKVKVKPGYGRNYLIPQNKAVYGTEKNNPKILMEGSGDAATSQMPKFYANKWYY